MEKRYVVFSRKVKVPMILNTNRPRRRVLSSEGSRPRRESEVSVETRNKKRRLGSPMASPGGNSKLWGSPQRDYESPGTPEAGMLKPVFSFQLKSLYKIEAKAEKPESTTNNLGLKKPPRVIAILNNLKRLRPATSLTNFNIPNGSAQVNNKIDNSRFQLLPSAGSRSRGPLLNSPKRLSIQTLDSAILENHNSLIKDRPHVISHSPKRSTTALPNKNRNTPTMKSEYFRCNYSVNTRTSRPGTQANFPISQLLYIPIKPISISYPQKSNYQPQKSKKVELNILANDEERRLKTIKNIHLLDKCNSRLRLLSKFKIQGPSYKI